MSNEEIPNGFRMTELGPLPDEWEVVRLGDVFDFSKKPRSLNIEHNDLIPFIPMEYIPDDGIYSGKYDLKRPEEIKSGSFFFKGDLLVAKITPSFENGKQCVVEELPTDFGYATTEVWPIHETDRTNILYLFCYLKEREIRTNIAGKMEGSTGRQRVPKNVLENLIIPLPSLPEQCAIAKVLSTVQEAKEKTDAVITATKELKKSLMKHLFTYGPVPLAEAENVPLKETEVGLVPDEWDVVRLGEKFIVKTSFPTFNSIQNMDTKNNDDELVLALKVSDMNNPINQKYINESLITFRHPISEVTKRRFLQPGSIIFPKRGAAISTNKKRITRYYSILDPNLIAIEPQKNIHKEYLFGFFEQFDLRSLQDNTPIPQLNKNQVESILLPLPHLPAQQRIASILSAVDEKIEKEETKKKALDELFKSLLNTLMTTKIRVDNMVV